MHKKQFIPKLCLKYFQPLFFFKFPHPNHRIRAWSRVQFPSRSLRSSRKTVRPLRTLGTARCRQGRLQILIFIKYTLVIRCPQSATSAWFGWSAISIFYKIYSAFLTCVLGLSNIRWKGWCSNTWFCFTLGATTTDPSAAVGSLLTRWNYERNQKILEKMDVLISFALK